MTRDMTRLEVVLVLALPLVFIAWLRALIFEGFYGHHWKWALVFVAITYISIGVEKYLDKKYGR